jgi:hypothetical protein|tara:strand:- start:218 stop:457 length:240 start_codon:yes stop_codon:yes gene_type:complete
MIFKKGNMWKAGSSSAKYATEEEALKAAGIRQAVIREAPVEKTSWNPLEKLRGSPSCECEECKCDPCECEKEWKSADET